MGTLVRLRKHPTKTLNDLTPAERAFERDLYQAFFDSRTSTAYAKKELAEIQRFRTFVNAPIWMWELRDLADYRAHLKRRYTLATRRGKEGPPYRISAFASHPGYRFNEQCLALTGRQIRPLKLPGHHSGAETTKRRNFTRGELAKFFSSARNYARTAIRRCDYLARITAFAMFHFVRAFGVRANEMAQGDEADLNPAVTAELASFSAFEDFHVRFGKASNGGGPKRRSVPSIYLFRRSLDVVIWYVTYVRPHLVRPGSPDALFLTYAGTRYRAQSLSTMFTKYRKRAGVSADLTLHCLRHTFVTHLREAGLSLRDTSKLVGHEHETTTSQTYDHMAGEDLRRDVLQFQRRVIAESERFALVKSPC